MLALALDAGGVFLGQFITRPIHLNFLILALELVGQPAETPLFASVVYVPPPFLVAPSRLLGAESPDLRVVLRFLVLGALHHGVGLLEPLERA